MCPPSNGGIGSKLNIPIIRFVITAYLKKITKGTTIASIRLIGTKDAKNVKNSSFLNIQHKRLKIIARRKLTPGPAKDVITKPCLKLTFLKLYGFIGTGFAQPNKNVELIKIKSPGTNKEPNISI
jgi:hypothetical protein